MLNTRASKHHSSHTIKINVFPMGILGGAYSMYGFLQHVIDIKPETKAAQPSGQELTETATVGLQHGKGRGGRRGPIGTSMPPY